MSPEGSQTPQLKLVIPHYHVKVFRYFQAVVFGPSFKFSVMEKSFQNDLVSTVIQVKPIEVSFGIYSFCVSC